MARLNRDKAERKPIVVNYDRDFEGRRNPREEEEGVWYGHNYGYDYDEELGFFDDDTSWRRSEKLKSGVGRNDYGDNDVLKEHFGNGYYGHGPKGWKRSDERIREDVCEALYRDYDIDARDIDVYVKDRAVYLKGSVDHRQTKRAAERLAETILGVEDVVNELRVRPAGEEPSEEDHAQINSDRDQQDSNTFG